MGLRSARIETLGMAIRVLVADARLAAREAVRAMLALEPDLEIVGESADGESTLRLARELRPDLVVLDAAMPGISGLDVSRTLAAELPDTGVVFLTLDPALRDLALAGGAMAYALKDGPPEEFLRAIRSTIAALSARRRLLTVPAHARRLVDLLISTGALDSERVDDLLRQRGPYEQLAACLRRLESVPDAELASLLAQASGTPLVSLAAYPEVGGPIRPTEDRIAAPRMVDPIDRAAARLLPLDLSRAYGILIIAAEAGEGVLAMADPLDDRAHEDAESASGRRLSRGTATYADIADALERAWTGATPSTLPYRIVGAWRSLALALVLITLPVFAIVVIFRDGLAPDRIFALLALLCGFFFFAYALKYYITSAAVLAIALLGDSLVLGKKKAHGNGRAKSGDGPEHKEGYKTLRGEKLDQAGAVLADARPIIGQNRLPIARQPFVSVQVALYNEARVVDRLLAACTSFDYENYE